jgi:hypothetical protein
LVNHKSKFLWLWSGIFLWSCIFWQSILLLPPDWNNRR